MEGLPTGDLLTAIESAFGTLSLKQKSSKAGQHIWFGWCVHKGGKLDVCGTPNQDNH
jgi:Fe-Mn family superoxide dismutase